MDDEALIFESQIQETHWWFTGRRFLFGKIIRRLGLDPESRILDLGCGSGTNLSMLRSMSFQNIKGLDISPAAVELCRQRGFVNVELGNICETGLPSGHFDLVLATDVLEHVEDDRAALREIRRLLKRGRSAFLPFLRFRHFGAAGSGFVSPPQISSGRARQKSDRVRSEARPASVF